MERKTEVKGEAMAIGIEAEDTKWEEERYMIVNFCTKPVQFVQLHQHFGQKPMLGPIKDSLSYIPYV